MGNFAEGEFFLLSGNLARSYNDYSNLFSKPKTTFCKYWTSIKIKISMTCVYKEYEIKIKMVQQQWLQLKMEFLLGYNMKTVM